MRPKVFLASSTSAKPSMKKLAGWLADWNLEPLPWDQPGLFQPGDYILERLLEISLNVEAAIILFGDEDKAWYRKDAKVQPRDNVLIEYGIFASRLGRQRTIVCRTGDPKEASDLGGLIFAQLGTTKAQISDAQAELQAWAQVLPTLAAETQKRNAERERANSGRLDSGIDSEYHLPGGPILRILTGSLKNIRDIDVIVISRTNTSNRPASSIRKCPAPCATSMPNAISSISVSPAMPTSKRFNRS